MKYWLLKYRTLNGKVYVVRVLEASIQTAWRATISHEWSNHRDLAVELLKHRCDGDPNWKAGVPVFQYIRTEEVPA